MALTVEVQEFTKLMDQEGTFDSIDDRLDFIRKCTLDMYRDAYKKPNNLLLASRFNTLTNREKLLLIKDVLDLLAKKLV